MGDKLNFCMTDDEDNICVEFEALLDPCNHYPKASSQDIIELIGIIPAMLLNPDFRGKSAKEALHTQYIRGGGWHSTEGFKMRHNGILGYPGDPDLYPYVKMTRDGEVIYQYPHAWVAIIQEDGNIDVARLD